MKIKNLLIALIFPVLMSSCLNLKPLELTEIESVNITEQTGAYANVQVKLKVKNPNKFKIKVSDYDLLALVNKKEMGKITIEEKRIVIPKNSDKTYTFNLKADMAQVAKLVPTLLFTNSALVNVKGEVKVKAMGVPKKVKLDIQQKVSKDDLNL
ncbi:MAG TPA: LEA type 2 family protein [Cytophagaceae bacterium]